MTYSVLLAEDAREYVLHLDDKSRRICKENLEKLSENPYPGRRKGDKEKLTVDGEEFYRMHIGRTHTAFYLIIESKKEVRVLDAMTIEEAHKRYD